MPAVISVDRVAHPVVWGQSITEADGVPGPTERCIEWPLALNVLRFDQPGWILDAGAACLPLTAQFPEKDFRASVVHVTQNLAYEGCYPREDRLSFVSADLRDLSLFRDHGVDRVGCISTLEHIGCDNHAYGGTVEQNPDSMWTAIKELWRITKQVLFLTVPVHPSGRTNGRWRYLTPADLGIMAGIFSPGMVHIAYYAVTRTGRWYGGGFAPLPFTETPTAKPRQIACVLVTR